MENEQKREQTPDMDFDGTCLLVSDSDERMEQLDSKQLEYDTLVEMAQENLFGKFLDMSRYLTVTQYARSMNVLNSRLNHLKEIVDSLPTEPSPKLRAVDGQVILVEASHVPSGKSPQDWVRENWNITKEFNIVQIQDCALRGISTEKENVGKTVQKPNNANVTLSDKNIPSHRHHSCVTSDSNFTTLAGDAKNTTYGTRENMAYDVFYNDSSCVGVENQAKAGVVD